MQDQSVAAIAAAAVVNSDEGRRRLLLRRRRRRDGASQWMFGRAVSRRSDGSALLAARLGTSHRGHLHSGRGIGPNPPKAVILR